MKPTMLVTLLYLGYTISLQGQVYSGIIQNKKGEPLIGASLYWQGTQAGTVSDTHGRFEISSRANSQILVVEYLGYHKQEIVVAQDKLKLSIILDDAFNELEAVTITAGSFEASDKRKAAVLTPLDIVTTAGALGDINGALQTLPGTSIVGESGRLFVRGGDSRETQVYIDGMLVPVPYTTSAPNQSVRGRFNPFIFEGTTFSIGGYSAAYGQALSSILQLETKGIPVEDQLDLSLMSVGLDVTGTKLWDDGAATLSTSYYNLAPYMSLVPQNLDWSQEPEVLNTAISLRQKTGELGLLKTYVNYSRANSSQRYASPEKIHQAELLNIQNENLFATVSYKTLLGDKWSLQAGMSYTDNADDLRWPSAEKAIDKQAIYSRVTAKYFMSPKLTIHSGIELNHENYSVHVVPQREATTKLTLTDNVGSIFTEAQIHLSEKLAFRGGVRYESSTYLSDEQISPRFSLAYKSGEYSQLSFACGNYYQLPDYEFLLDSDQLTNEKATHYVLSYQFEKDRRLLRLEAYQKNYDDLIKVNAIKTSNDGDGYARGLDLFYKDQKTIKNAQFWVSYSYLDSKRDYRHYPYEAVPSYVSRHNASLVYKHLITDLQSMPSITFRYASPRLYNNPNEVGFNNQKLDAYKTVDLSWSYIYKPHMIFFASATNILAFEQDFGYQYSSVPNAEGVYEGIKIEPSADRFLFVGCFITFTKSGKENQLDKLN